MEIDEMRTDVEAALTDALSARPGLFAAVQTATRQAFDAAQRFESFCLRVARGSRHGHDPLTAAVRELLEDARAEKDRAAAALTRVQRELRNIEWSIECRRAELSQLELVANPPVEGRGPLYLIAKRPAPPGLDDDNIVFPGGKPPAA
jgi:hypothetical protein